MLYFCNVLIAADKTAKVYDVKTNECVYKLGDDISSGAVSQHSYGINDVQWCFDDRYIVTCSGRFFSAQYYA